MSEHTPTPWQDPGEHALTGYGDINHVVVGADKKVIGSLYANCFDAPHMRQLPTVAEAAANAAFIVKAVNSHDALVEALQAVQGEIVLTGQLAELVDRVLASVVGGAPK